MPNAIQVSLQFQYDARFYILSYTNCSQEYLAQLVACLPHRLRVMSSRPASGKNYLFI